MIVSIISAHTDKAPGTLSWAFLHVASRVKLHRSNVKLFKIVE